MTEDSSKPMTETKTFENLQKAFEMEASQVNLYFYFAKIAEAEGYEHAVEIFERFAEGGICSAHGNLDFFRDLLEPITQAKIGQTKENLRASIASESFSGSQFYMNSALEAHQEGLHDIASWFETMEKAKNEHVKKLNHIVLTNKEKDGNQ